MFLLVSGRATWCAHPHGHEYGGRFPFRKKTGNFGGSKSGISDWQKVVPFGRKPRYVAVPDGEPGTGTNYEKRKWDTTFRSEIPTGKTGPPF